MPLVQTVRSRRRFGRSIGPDRTWLRKNGVEPTLVETLRTLPILYLVIPYLRSAAQLQGWVRGRRLRDAVSRRRASSRRQGRSSDPASQNPLAPRRWPSMSVAGHPAETGTRLSAVLFARARW